MPAVKRAASTNSVDVPVKRLDAGTIRKYIDLRKLDFDQVKRCSVKCTPLEVYCCLQCGKFLQGRGARSPCFLHAVNNSRHSMFMNLRDAKVYELPLNREVDTARDTLLQRLQLALQPQFESDRLQAFPQNCTDLVAGKQYTNGFVGITGKPQLVNYIVILLAHITPVRDNLLLCKQQEGTLVGQVTQFVQRLWSTTLLRGHVSPEEWVSYLQVHSRDWLDVTDPKLAFNWLINQLIKSPLQDTLASACRGEIEVKQTSRVVPFWNVTLDLPTSSATIFKDGREVNDLPQIQLSTLLQNKFDSDTAPYMFRSLPEHLIVYYNRHSGARLPFPVRDRNQTMVDFPLTVEFPGNHRYRLQGNLINDVVRSSDIATDDTNHWKLQLLNTNNDQWYEIDGPLVTAREQELLFLKETYLQVWRRV
ncbi:mRNA splicing protein SAD1 KNAG_0D02510 [Huiozyma naganishii CBS 8797]|uniref:USP domain-containing protein n=1 Tax=Huiozyma naganishii (strain ATCC MYA-139 / BCRC 22969 / CBS 8797 / KCTC 17520 / NBRC 10181 / NCYC 3082 / Yp74L-3) TaxID=1071383 RepID=J7R595_HUIN7|nr:hypothetical protein KNAG_0D02510 [Kazachstania naganishii CBS 8797]CCK70000.1 hypothetical protein KNAG_0D02510 [Kazachstania naganishii CBS 8797]